MRITRVMMSAAVAAMVAIPAAAQVPLAPGLPSLGLSIGVKASTLGVGVDLGYRFIPRLSVRLGANWASYNRDDLEIADFAYVAKLRWRTIQGLLDLHVLGPLHLSAGLVHNGNQVELKANPTGSVQIGGTTYTSTQVDTIFAKFAFKKAAPYFGLGIATGGRVGFVLELGGMMQGSPQLTYSATTTLTGAAKTQFDAQATAERDDLQAQLDDKPYLKFYPVVALGFQVKI